MKYAILPFLCISITFAEFTATWETGFLSVLRHTIQFSREGTLFDYVE
ncbi:hypothetical protein [Chitinivibrio alkaliphilus]|uniref:Uncharacterized protein n=1 Tax=Chitinivibrio alkaliphilus ACht1 TaxID=1313304 RepID=U7D8L7_9BACT|nr:hypothetical protein [Chitinivibrio alkaliphilus]ERP38744.1 hypothetical protein CALK_0763 [Chitinivibrio alkaliphilus ACht1]